MELAAQYALQIAVNTLQERCKVLSHRVSVLEEENVQLRKSCLKEEETSSLTEIQKLREKVTQLTQEKEQLQEKARMVISENQELWKRLGKLDTVNKYYVEEFNKISETVSQNRTPLQAHTALIRSKTFTQDEPITKCFQKNLELNEKISMELENISLKLSDSFSKQKMELEKFSSELNELKTSEMIGEHLGFGYNENIEDDLFDEFQFVLQDLKVLKSEVVEHKEILRRNAKNLIYLCKESEYLALKKYIIMVLKRVNSVNKLIKFVDLLNINT